MYRRILLASDGSRETLVALREGALIAQTFGAKAHLLIIDRNDAARITADGVCHPNPAPDAQALLKLGLGRLSRLGVVATGELLRGEPAHAIANAAKRFRADLIIIGHRRQTFLERWWAGSSGAHILDSVGCSVMIARDTITDAQFDTYLESHRRMSGDWPSLVGGP